MNGFGIIKGLGVTLRHFLDTYIQDLRWIGKHYRPEQKVAMRSSSKTRGIFTVQYPEEKLPVPENFRFNPFLVYDEGPNGEKEYRCTSCGICAKVCPSQCIHIYRACDPITGRPIPAPAEFWIDVDLCMNCGYCSEYCPFDAIIADHDYEIATFDRLTENIYNKEKLGKPASYYRNIKPVHYAQQEAARAEKEAAKAAGKKDV